MTMLVLTTGGTIDSAPYPETGAPDYITPTETHLSMEVLRAQAADQVPVIELDWIEVCNKDSKNFDENDQAALYNAVAHNSSQYERIIITTGTDRMTDIANDLKHRLHGKPACPVVFTGAIWPLENKDKSDGVDNLKLALLKSPTIEPDVYIAMHGLFEPCERIKKDVALKKFVLITG